jgi:hypothetical protein
MGFSFIDHVELLEHFLAARPEIVEEIDRRLLNLKGKPIRQHTSRGSWTGILNGCFFELPTLPIKASKLRGELETARFADGFEPMAADGYVRDLDPIDLILRAHHHWDHSRWPGRSGRILYAQNIYTVFMMRQLEHLSMRIWDEGNNAAADRLQQVQHVLDLLNTGGALPRVRDSRWLIQSAQSSLTKHVEPYFTIAERVAGSFTDRDRLEIHKAGAMLAGGHLRSQLRHRSWQTGWTVDDPQLLAITRLSNSMDMALLVGDLIPLLDAYNAACDRQDHHERLALADAILQGLSADPELLVTRLDLLAPSTVIEELFVDGSDGGRARYTPMGEAHLERVKRYCKLIGRTAEPLRQDAASLDPSAAAYSPLGMVYGFCADIPSNMVLSTLRSSSSTDLSLEDLFVSRERLEEKLMQAQEWQRLPKGEGERDPFEHSTEWAGQMFARLVTGLNARTARPTALNASSTPDATLYVVPSGVLVEPLGDNALPAGIVSAQEHCLTSDPALSQFGATVLSRSRLAADRSEGRFLASANVGGDWFGIGKAALTMCTSQGHDALMRDVPPRVVEVLRVVCPELVVVVQHSGT